MRVIAGFTIGFIAALLIASTVERTVTVTETITETIIEEVMTTIDLDRIRQVEPTSTHDEQLLAECAHAIARHTGEPFMGIILYIERHWEGDACAALEHYHLHGWY